jgi:hypothetical protein
VRAAALWLGGDAPRLLVANDEGRELSLPRRRDDRHDHVATAGAEGDLVAGPPGRRDERAVAEVAAVDGFQAVRRAHRAILSDLDVVAIRQAAVERREKSGDLARVYGVDAAYIRRLVRGEARRGAGGPTVNRADGRPARDRQVRLGFGSVALEELPDLVADQGARGLPVTFSVEHLPVEPDRRASVLALLESLGVELVGSVAA